MAPSRDEIIEKVKAALIEALGVDDDEIELTATLQGDLGAESIDFLDIVFRLEKAFGIKIPKAELFPDEILSNPEYRDGDRITPSGLAKLKATMPHVDFSKFQEAPLVSRVPDLFTVQAIINYVQSKTAAA